ncbi:fatty acid desaturase [Sphaerimonospora cavernae]|uniref:Fatty acid desaturase n=1 Tax=Sphaerimonospora cavernae TaxID=1740611 RepID=A0ABV6U069_9ACTN
MNSGQKTPLRDFAFDGSKFRAYRFDRKIEERVKRLNKLDNWHAPLSYVCDVLLIGVSVAACIWWSYWLYPLALLVIGSRQRAFSNLLHESAHGMLTKNRKLNLALGTVLTAYPIFQQHYAYKRNHVATHHPRLGDPERDPDLRYFIEQGVYEPATRRELWLRLVILPALGSKIVSHFWFLLKDRILINRRSDPKNEGLSEHWRIRIKRDTIALSAFWCTVLILVATTGTLLEFVLFWLVPYMTVFQLIGWYIELSEHTPMVRFHNTDLCMTRNRKSRGLERFLTGTYADHYHLDHHLDPRTPYWNLRRAHEMRMEDPRYAAIDAEFGGLFSRGPEGQPSALASIIEDLSTHHDDTLEKAA